MQDGRRVAGAVHEAGAGPENRLAQPGHQPDGQAGQGEPERGEGHRQGHAVVAVLELGIDLRRGGHRTGGDRVGLWAEAQEDPARGAQDRPAGQAGGHDEHHGQPEIPIVLGRLLDQRLAEPGPEWRQRRDRQSADHDHRPGDSKRPRPALQVKLVDRAVEVLEHPHGDEQRGLQEAVGDDEQRDAGERTRVEQPEAGEEEADVGDGREGQHPLEVPRPEAEARAHERREDPRGDQDDLKRLLASPERAGEDRPVHPRERVQP